jgi:hypothetical protein
VGNSGRGLEGPHWLDSGALRKEGSEGSGTARPREFVRRECREGRSAGPLFHSTGTINGIVIPGSFKI